MKRKLITFCIIIICFLMECTIFHRLSFASIKPNLLIIITSSFGFMRGKKEGLADMAVHAGLECGILGSKYTHWDMISFGPTICSPHSPDERVNIASVGKFWEYLKATLKNIPAK